MENKQKSLREQMAMWAAGQKEYCEGFFDWFCTDKALEDKARKLQARVRNFVKKMEAKGMAIDLDKHYVFFKNNCPANGPLYDSFSICSIDEGKVKFWVTPKSGHHGKPELWVGDQNREIVADTFHELIAKV